jgi:hypothetical protein
MYIHLYIFNRTGSGRRAFPSQERKMRVQTDNLRQAYDLAYRKACGEFARWQPADMAASAGCGFDAAGGTISLRYLGDDHVIRWPDGEVLTAGGEPAAITVSIVLLHYLLRAGGQPLTGRLISFKEIPGGGMIYLDAYNKRIINYILAVFGNRPALLIEAGRALGGQAAPIGHYGLRLDVLPRLPLTFALWAGDDELPAGATVLYDASAPFYLPTEDLIEATAYSVRLLARTAKKLT